jgi:hypothetical protein
MVVRSPTFSSMAVSKQAFMLSVITQFWVIPQNSSFFKIKIKKIKYRLAMWRKLIKKNRKNR